MCVMTPSLYNNVYMVCSDDRDRDEWIKELQKAVKRSKKLTDKERRLERQQQERERKEHERREKELARLNGGSVGGKPFFSKLRGKLTNENDKQSEQEAGDAEQEEAQRGEKDEEERGEEKGKNRESKSSSVKSEL